MKQEGELSLDTVLTYFDIVIREYQMEKPDLNEDCIMNAVVPRSYLDHAREVARSLDLTLSEVLRRSLADWLAVNAPKKALSARRRRFQAE